MAKHRRAAGAVMEYKPPSPAERLEMDAKMTAETIVRESPKFKKEVERISKAIASTGKQAMSRLRNARSA